MKEPFWIEKTTCLAFHSALVARFGGTDGMRDEGRLDNALDKPRNLFHYDQPTHFELAAAYAAGIVKGHPFLDGNKRSGLMTAAVFLEMNGYEFLPSEEDAALQTLALADLRLTESEFADWLAFVCKPQA
ncbi:type II toxin-antitoxin system death-on-curing family toxin [Coraliomargarita algicola]|uniref:Type II toxin-antitoxin system death-on-curing family toxin n=2 Tax=Coraliomargaritaceae TaxID=3056371 RepID=A0ABU1AWF8_9BACT|nr:MULTISPECIES: type II toxin-antitoxin system death-on-curing family toxin [unclassified Coraliomargarita]MDQ8208478.1 type II toxin-antitoxin system death-on-curing family toxin [Coraliomargarita sp. SDUM461003]WPJ94136.1 type II toxin-antitoxin system death-on-curing family toxin [Coraliomargarita sp. J2-16]